MCVAWSLSNKCPVSLKTGLDERQPGRLSLSTSQMLMLREIPTPPRSNAGSEGPTTMVPLATPHFAIRQVRRSSGSNLFITQTIIHPLIGVQQ